MPLLQGSTKRRELASGEMLLGRLLVAPLPPLKRSVIKRDSPRTAESSTEEACCCLRDREPSAVLLLDAATEVEEEVVVTPVCTDSVDVFVPLLKIMARTGERRQSRLKRERGVVEEPIEMAGMVPYKIHELDRFVSSSLFHLSTYGNNLMKQYFYLGFLVSTPGEGSINKVFDES